MKRENKKLLINFVYCRPVGHVVEALKFAKGFFDANKNSLTSLLSGSPKMIIWARSFVITIIKYTPSFSKLK